MFDNFPYTNFHEMNLDWMIKIAKDFLDQYTHIQETITQGLEDLDTKAQQLEALLQAWYDQHSQDIADQLADALADLNEWYNQHQGYLDQELQDNITAFNQAAEQKAAQTIASIPADYTNLTTLVNAISAGIANPFDSANTYKVGDIIWKDNKYYKCRTPIVLSGTPFNPVDWIELIIATEIERNTNLIENVDRQLRSETGEFEKYYVRPNNGYLYAIRDNIPTLVQNPACCCAEIDVFPGWAFKITSTVFSWMDGIFFCDASGNIIGITPRETATIQRTYQVIVPGFCTKMYVNSALSAGLNIEKLENKTNLYEYIHAENKNLWSQGTDTAIFGLAHFVNDDPLKIEIDGANGGISLGKFFTNSAKVRVNVTGNASCNGLRFYYRYYDASAPAWYNIQVYSDVSGANFNRTFDFDAAYYIQYHNASNFDILVNTAETSGEIEITGCNIIELSNLEQSQYYDADFDSMMQKIVAAIDNHEQSINNLENSGVVQTLFNGNGKFTLAYTNNGSFVAVPNIPAKTLFLGNSLLCGMDTFGEHGGMFGMAATSPYKDYAYYVEQAILAHNASATFNKLSDAAFEQCETIGAAQQWINNNTSFFTSDLDLIFIQIGDNVNTDTRKQVFAESFPKLIKTIRQTADRARIIIVTGWFNHQALNESMSVKTGCEYISIADLNTVENQGTPGETVTYYDGSTISLPAAWASHPGDAGMLKIANRMIDKMDMDY